MKKWDYDGAEMRTDSLLPTSRNKKCWFMPADDRKITISSMIDDLDVIPAPGLRDIKAVELYTKWRPIIPPEAQHITCPKPPDVVMERVKTKKNKKKQERAGKKRKANDDEEYFF